MVKGVVCGIWSLAYVTWVAQLDACPTGNQEVMVLTPAGSATFFLEINHEIFSKVILSPFANSRMAVVSFWWKNVLNTG